MQQNRTSRKLALRPRSSQLDGLAGVVLIFLMCGQAHVPGFASSSKMLCVLLVLSGYLSTCTIVRIFDSEKGLGFAGLLRVWWQRIRHTLPSIVSVVAIVAAICATAKGALLAAMRPDVLPSLGYFVNWTNLLNGIAAGKSSSPLGNMWFPAMEMQLFLVWSALLAALLNTGKAWTRRISLALATLGTFWLVLQCVLGGNLIRLGLATDAQAYAFLMGAWLALAFPLGRVPSIGKKLLIKDTSAGKRHRRRRYRATAFANVLGVISLLGIVATVIMAPSNGTLSYGVTTIALSALAVALIASLLAPGSWMGKVLSIAPLSWLGSRALGVYLWCYPIFIIIASNGSETPWYLFAAAAAATLAAGELSYRLIELPFASSSMLAAPRQRVEPVRLAATTVAIAIAAVFGARSLIAVPSEAASAASPNAAAAQTPSSTTPAQSTSSPVTSDTNAGDGTSSTSKVNSNDSNSNSSNFSSSSSSIVISEDTVIHAPANETKSGKYNPVLIGDSVPGDADWSQLPDALVDTYVGRRPDQALEVLRSYVDQGGVGSVVVLACFSNVIPTADQLDEFASMLGDERSIYLVGTKHPDGYMDETNEAIIAACERHDNMHYVDWPAVEKGHDKEYLWDDVTHLRPEGAVVYVNMVMEAIAQDIVDAGGTIEG